MATMPRLPSRFAWGGGRRAPPRFLIGRICGRGLRGGRRILREPRFQRVDAVMELPQFITQGVQIGLHSRRSLCPVLRSKGKRPDGMGRLRQRVHDVSRRPTTRDRLIDVL